MGAILGAMSGTDYVLFGSPELSSAIFPHPVSLAPGFGGDHSIFGAVENKPGTLRIKEQPVLDEELTEVAVEEPVAAAGLTATEMWNLGFAGAAAAAAGLGGPTLVALSLPVAGISIVSTIQTSADKPFAPAPLGALLLSAGALYVALSRMAR